MLADVSADHLVGHLAEIGYGICRITDAMIAAQPDFHQQQVLTGLLYLHEELELRRERQARAEDALRKANDELERQVAARTEALEKSQQQLSHAQKMEAVGRLAGGIAHDFNNLLSVVMSYSSLILSDLRANDPLRADIQEILKAGSRAAELTKQLLAFSRQQVFQTKIVDVNEIVGGMELMARRLLGADVSLTFLPAANVGRVRADPGQIEQVIMNLVVNGRDAMPSGGKLTIETGDVILDADYAALHHSVVPGRYVVMAITDTGMGMTKETQARIFEPFFTTKELGKETGLGLSTVFGIVHQSGGHVWVYSEPGKGTVFKVYFPHVDGVVAEAPAFVPPSPTGRRGSETILLVEDDDQVRSVVRGILRRSGYHVLEAPNGGEALLICEQHGAQIQLLLTDVILPHMSGPQLVKRVASLRSEMRVLFMSGYTGDAIVHHGVLDSGTWFLQKPITPDALTRKVREVLDASLGAGVPKGLHSQSPIRSE